MSLTHGRRPRLRLVGALALAALLAPAPAPLAVTACAQERSAGVPDYQVPTGLAPTAISEPLGDAVRRAVQTAVEPPSADVASEAVRLLAGLGLPALPEIVEALASARWDARATLVLAIAEMEAPEVTPLLVAAAEDPSFAVREAALLGLGKIGDHTAAPALLVHVDPAREPAWRVRVAAVTAIRRAALRGTLDRGRADEALTAALDDPDNDVREQTVREIAPLRLESALPRLLELFGDRETASELRQASLDALRRYEGERADLIAALRLGFAETDDATDAVEAGAALLALKGASELRRPEIADTVLRQLLDSGRREMREALVRLGEDAAPWLREHAERLVLRIAVGRIRHDDTPTEALIETLLQVDEASGIEVLLNLLGGPDAEVLALETRRFALAKVRLAYARRLRSELRRIFDGGSGASRDLLPELLQAIAASGGDDLPDRIDRALEHEESSVRRRALVELKNRPEIPARGALRRLIAEGETPRLRAEALDALARRESDEAMRIAAELLEAPNRTLRSRAIDVLKDPAAGAHVDVLRARLATEDGSTDRGPRLPEEPQPAEGESAEERQAALDTHAERVAEAHAAYERETASARSRLRRSLLSAVATASSGDEALPLLLETLAGAGDESLRHTAARLLRTRVRLQDVRLLLSLLDSEPALRSTLLDALLAVEGSREADDLFTARIADSATRAETLRLVAQPDARVRPAGLSAGVRSADWKEDEKERALIALERMDDVPPVPVLVALVKASTTDELFAESIRLIATHGDSAAAAALERLLEEVGDTFQRTEIARRLGEHASPAAVPALLTLLARTRPSATSALTRRDDAVELYRQCAIALGRCGTDEAARALIAEALSPRLARAGARHSALENGPFRPRSSATVRLIRGLVIALAHVEPARLERLTAAHLERLASDGRLLMLDEGYVDGVARYLADPSAYDLPPRRRTRTALLLWQLVRRLAPRMTAIDREALGSAASELESLGREAEAARAAREQIALADIEDSGRPEGDREWESARLASLDALAASRAGDRERAQELARSILSANPQSGDLAYLQGRCLAKLGGSFEAAREAIELAIARDAENPRARFYLGWIVERLEGPAAGLSHYADAVRLDLRRVHRAGGAYLTHRRGRQHPWSHYHYWFARAQALAGYSDAAAKQQLESAIRYDDRDGPRALADPAFEPWSDLQQVVDASLAAIPHW